GPQIDPFSLAGPNGIVIANQELTLVGVGTAVLIPLPGGLEDDQGVVGVRRQLAAIDTDDRVKRPGSGLVAFGGLPFDREAAGSLVVPELLYGRSADGSEWVTIVTDGATPPSSSGLRANLLARSCSPVHNNATGTAGAARTAVTAGVAGAATPSVTPLTSERSFMGAVAHAVRDIRRGDLRKVVLARQIDLTFDTAIDVPALLRRWRDIEPTATVFSIPVEEGQFLGASPELLVERRGAAVRCRPLAGTSSRPSEDLTGASPPSPQSPASPQSPPSPANSPPSRTADLRKSAKDTSEHRFVVEAIADALGPMCTHLDVPSTPDLVHLHNVSHLGTSISGTLSGGSSGPASVLELVATLHPTPAVGGVPREQALRAIAELEPSGRAHYAGPVGWMDAHGDGRWVVGIRAASVAGRHARLAAGVGIVERSDPASELRETNWKFTAVFDALAPGRQLSVTDASEALQVDRSA
ncbi:MAG: isochorismate synthase, partial [Acidimicrobiaceae bacterium]|nr:isochorismate synthase [Acidimicrobiaceae bacterium]